jgi:hypothetical protein
MNRWRHILTASMTIGSMLVAAQAFSSVLWKADFATKGIEQFNIYDVGPQISPELAQSSGPSKWYVQNGALNQDSNIYGTPDPADGTINEWTGTQAVAKDFSAQDGVFFIQFSTADDDGIGIVFRYQDEKNFMRFFSLRDPGNGGPATRIEKWTDGVMQILDMTTDTVYQQNVPETMLVVAKGDKIDCYVGDLNAPVLSVTDPDPKPGSMGVALYAMSKTNNIPLAIYNIEALTPDSNLYLANLTDADSNQLGGYWASLSQNGKSAGGVFTNPEGQALFLDVPTGDYDLSLGGLTLNPASQKATVKAGITSGAFTIDPARNTLVSDLSSSADGVWVAKIPALATDDYSDPAASESGFVPYEAPSDDWDSMDSDNGVFGWLRTHVSAPAAAQGKDLALTGFTFSSEDWVYWNGQLIGHSTDNSVTQTYVIPGSLVKADNVLAIRGYKVSGTGGLTGAAPQVYVANPSITITGVAKDASGTPLANVPVSAVASDTAWGLQKASTTTGADGSYRLSGLAPGTYEISRDALGTADAANIQTVTQTATAGQSLTADFTTAPVFPLSTANGLQWKVIDDTAQDDESYAKTTGVDESAFSDVVVPATLESQSLGADFAFSWYRVHFQMPADFKSFQGKDLILTGFNVDDADVTYFNGTKIGSDGTFPTDPLDPNNTGYVGESGDVRTYTIPANLVNWTGDNVLAINGYDAGGDAGITATAPVITVVGGSVTPPPTTKLGDLNGDGNVNVQDATLSLRIAVGLLTPSDAQKTAGDVNKDGKWNVQDATLILRAAVGLGDLS